MTDQEVIAAIRRKMAGIGDELSLHVPEPATAQQWQWAMQEFDKEFRPKMGWAASPDASRAKKP